MFKWVLFNNFESMLLQELVNFDNDFFLILGPLILRDNFLFASGGFYFITYFLGEGRKWRHCRENDAKVLPFYTALLMFAL